MAKTVQEKQYEVRWISATTATSPMDAAKRSIEQITEHDCQAFEVRAVGTSEWVQVDVAEGTIDGIPAEEE